MNSERAISGLANPKSFCINCDNNPARFKVDNSPLCTICTGAGLELDQKSLDDKYEALREERARKVGGGLGLTTDAVHAPTD